MPRLSPVDAVGPAFARVGTMLFHPFRLRTWLKMGFIGWLAGAVVTASTNFNFHAPSRRLPTGQDPFEAINRAIHSIHFAQFVGFMAVLVMIVIVGMVFTLIFTYLFSRFRFILFDTVVSSQVVVGRGWRRYRDQGNRYFGFWLLYTLISWIVVGLIVGVPVWRAYKRGVFQGDQPIWAFFGLLASVILGLLAYAVISAIVSTLAKDFVMPMMALDDLSVGQAFSALWQYIAAEPGAWAGYLGMKLVFALVGGIGMGIVSLLVLFFVLILLAIPAGLLIWAGVSAMKIATGLGIAIFILTGLAVIAACFCVIMCLCAPVSIFFAAYAFYFFGGRYPKLGALLWPQQPTPPGPAALAVATS